MCLHFQAPALTSEETNFTKGGSVQSALSALPSVGAVTVARNAHSSGIGFVWTVTFDGPLCAGDQPQLKIGANDTAATGSLESLRTATVLDGSGVAGGFALSFKGAVTNPLPVNASAQNVADELSGLTTLGTALVTRTGPDGAGGHSWRVTFADVPTGNVEEIQTDGTALFTHAMDGTAKVKVTTAQNGSVIRGLYRLTFPGPGSHGYETWNLAYNATAAQVKGAYKNCLCARRRSSKDGGARVRGSVLLTIGNALCFV